MKNIKKMSQDLFEKYIIIHSTLGHIFIASNAERLKAYKKGKQSIWNDFK